MAGETRGQLAEAIAKVALEAAVASLSGGQTVYWEEAPTDAVIRPDLTIGVDKDHPESLVLVNASDTARNSDIKYWRNVGEVFDAKSRLDPAPAVMNLVFKTEIKPELIRLAAAISDSSHLVDRDAVHGKAITDWLDANHSSAPSGKSGKEALVRSASTPSSGVYDRDFAEALNHLGSILSSMIYHRRTDLFGLWNLAAADFRSRLSRPVRASRLTLLRRGTSRWLVFDEPVRRIVFRAHALGKTLPRDAVPSYAEALGMLETHVGGGRIPEGNLTAKSMAVTVGADLHRAASYYLEATSGDVDAAWSAFEASLVDVPDEMQRFADQLRAMPSRVGEWHQYVLTHWDDLTTPMGCYRALMSCRGDPTMGGALGVQDPSRVWLYDHLIATLRSFAERNNDFGYGALGSYFKSRHADAYLRMLFEGIMAELAPAEARAARRWISQDLVGTAEPGRRGFQDWLAGTKRVSPVIVGAYAFALSRMLSEIANPAGIDFRDVVARHAYGLWNKLLTYQDFEPLPGLIQGACGALVARVSAPTVIADLAGQAVQEAGRMPAFSFDGGLICWKSVTDSGKGHKRKELGGRARALRFQRTENGFRIRSGMGRLLLVVDGTFDDTDLRVLSESGWDEIFYPDEMTKLRDSIASGPVQRLSADSMGKGTTWAGMPDMSNRRLPVAAERPVEGYGLGQSGDDSNDGASYSEDQG